MNPRVKPRTTSRSRKGRKFLSNSRPSSLFGIPMSYRRRKIIILFVLITLDMWLAGIFTA